MLDNRSQGLEHLGLTGLRTLALLLLRPLLALPLCLLGAEVGERLSQLVDARQRTGEVGLDL